MTKLSAQVSAILNNILNGLISFDDAVAAILRLIESESGAGLAAQRKIVEKACQNCGKMFTGLEKKVLCNTCINTKKAKRYRARKAKN